MMLSASIITTISFGKFNNYYSDIILRILMVLMINKNIQGAISFT